jgi:hypothetical protein
MLVSVRIELGTKVLKSWGLHPCSENCSVGDLLGSFFNGTIEGSPPTDVFGVNPEEKPVAAYVGQKPEKSCMQTVILSARVGEVASFGRYFLFILQGDEPEVRRDEMKSAFNVLMESAKELVLPMRVEERTKKDKLYNDIVGWLASNKLGWRKPFVDTAGCQLVSTLTDALWYVDGHHQTLVERSCTVPVAVACFSGYNNPAMSKHKVKPMDCAELKALSQRLSEVTELPYMCQSSWQVVRTELQSFAVSLDKYVNYLQSHQQQAMANREQLYPVRQHDDAVSVIMPSSRLSLEQVERFKAVNLSLERTSDFEPVFLNDFCPNDVRARRTFLDGLDRGLTSKCIKYSHAYGNNKGTFHFLWKLPSSSTEADLVKRNSEVIASLIESFPIYHTRAMKRVAMRSFGKLCSVKPAFLREVYRKLTGDATAAHDKDQEIVDSRIREALDTEDPELIVDLRATNSGRPPSYDQFWDKCRKYITEHVELAADDRRHDTIVHLAVAMSVSDLHREVVKTCPEGVAIPSVKYLMYQFWPNDKTRLTACRYTGQLPVKFMIQSRQFRKTHIDCHYASAIFRYLKEFAIKYKEQSALVFMDDKHGIKIGEPGCPVAAVDRGKRVVVGISTKFAIADHDFCKGSFTPSVSFICDIPDTIEETFYRGQVVIGLKDAVFQASSPIRHTTELSSILIKADVNKPILLLYTDGGPDHRLTYMSVKVALLCLFFKHNLDMLIAVRTPPYHSWKNPVERIMSLLNLALQAVGIMRQPMNAEMEALIAPCNSMKAIRKSAERNPDLRDAYIDSLQSSKALLESLFCRLRLKNQQVQTFEAASASSIDDMWNEILQVDSTLLPTDTTETAMRSKTAFKQFLSHCCQERHYSFSIKKCGELSCPLKICRKPRLSSQVFESIAHLPDPVPGDDGEHYKSFQEVFGTKTSEKYRPSAATRSCHVGHGMPFNPTAQHARAIVTCCECNKPRVVYSLRKLPHAALAEFERAIECCFYTCGSVLQDVNELSDTLRRELYVRGHHQCSQTVEVPYYSCKLFENVCVYCGTSDRLVDETEILPTCEGCIEAHPKIYKRKRSKVNSASDGKKQHL